MNENKETIEIKGVVKRITFRADDGYTVMRLQADSGGMLTCVGYFIRIGEGDHIICKGRWVSHPRYGPQLSVESYRITAPETTDGIIRYLSSNLIAGIGEKMAERIVKRFGRKTMEIIDKEPNRLKEIPGIGEKRIAAIKDAWREHREVSELVVFLESHGVAASTALRIYKHYGPEAIKIVKDNPYRLASEVWGIGFTTADRIASKIGIPPDSPVRVRAAVEYALSQGVEAGHVFLPLDFLKTRCCALLGADEDRLDDSLKVLESEGRVIRENDRLYLPALFHAENIVASKIGELISTHVSFSPELDSGFLEAVQVEQGIELHTSQVDAVLESLQSKVMVITGGPGTGKTTIVRALLHLFERQGQKVCLAAPTGRAAKRMAELAGSEAKTIHRLLEYSPQEGLFRRNASNPLDADVVIIDEASMLDILLAASLLEALAPEASVIFVGDVDQLPPVGPGNFLGDLIESGRVPVRRLTRIFRQDAGSQIVKNAHRINAGEFPVLSRQSGEFFLIEQDSPGEVADTIVDICTRRLPARFGFDPRNDIQVLSPMYKGEAGATNLNSRLQQAINPTGKRFHETRFRVGDRVMQLRNNYEKMVFNGDLGEIVDYDLDEDKLIVRYDYEVAYDRFELDEITLAYAITVHKSQGSEFGCIIMPVITQHYIMLHRNLLYTAVTRAKNMVVLVGTRKALGLAVRNVRHDKRLSSLAERLRNV